MESGFSTKEANRIKPAQGDKSFFTTGRILFLLVLAAFTIRVLAVLTRQMIQLDETAYVRMAQNLASGHGLWDITGDTATHFSPLLPFFIAGVATMVRHYVLAAYIVVTIFGSLLLIPTYLLGAELSSRRVGLMAAALMAVTPLFVQYSSLVYTESVYIFFLLMGILFGYRMLRDRSILSGSLAGAAVGLAYLTNPSGIYYAVVLAALAVIIGVTRRSWRQMAKVLVVFLALFFIFAAPYIVFLHSQLGKWTYDGKLNSGNIYDSTHNISAGSVDWDRQLLSLTADNYQTKIMVLPNEDLMTYIIKQPVSAAKTFVNQSLDFYNQELPKVIPLWLLPLMGLGLFATAWNRRRALGVGYLLLMMGPVIVILAMYAHDRFFMPFVPLLMIWVAEGWDRLVGWARETVDTVFTSSRKQTLVRATPWVIGALVLLPVLAFAVKTSFKMSYPVGYKDAGLYIKQTAGQGHNVMSREYSAAYYSGGTSILLPYDDYNRTTDYARKHHVDFLVIGASEISTWRPTLSRLTGGESAHPDWKLVGRVLPGTSQETLIFRLQPAAGI
ncbi:MAG: glycosyltransferase family 39 protein [Actinobacteria bacterium]|nr:glycosyltransferase family 39 protein [Actinomycetota bacterium]